MTEKASVSATPLLCNVIAWSSLCLVGAGFGTFVHGEWRTKLLQTGVASLVAALGLSKAKRYRRTVVVDRKRKADAEIVEKRLNANVSALVPREETTLVVDRLMAECADGADIQLDRRSGARTLTSRRLITITTCDTTKAWHTMSGCLKDISAWGLGFVHQEELPLGPAVVTFVLDNEQLSLEVDLRWSKQISSKWFCSGGFFLGMRQTQKTISQIGEEFSSQTLRMSDAFQESGPSFKEE